MNNYQKVDMHISSICKTAYIVLLFVVFNFPVPTLVWRVSRIFSSPSVQSGTVLIQHILDVCETKLKLQTSNIWSLFVLRIIFAFFKQIYMKQNNRHCPWMIVLFVGHWPDRPEVTLWKVKLNLVTYSYIQQWDSKVDTLSR